MEKIFIDIPEGIYYLTDYFELDRFLPTGSYIFNKVMTGCGATTKFLDDNIPTVLCSPRKELIYCKANSDRYYGKVHLFGASISSASRKKEGNVVLEKMRILKEYISTTIPYTSGFRPINAVTPKILVTYDSTKHVIQALNEIGLLDRFRFVIDEFQTIFTDAAFRGDVEAEFMENIKNVSQVVYLSATPYLEDYLDLLPEFNTLPYVELKWPESSTHSVHIMAERYYNGSPANTIDRIIDNYKNTGFFEETMDSQGNIIRATEAVFFVNHVSFIIHAVKRNSLSPQDVNIICSSANDNESRLRKEGLQIGHVPKQGAPHYTYTFVTKAAFEGVDFYSTCAYTYIFSNINLENLAIDISLDLAQILGRQRLQENPFQYSATFYYKLMLEYTAEDHQCFFDKISQKKCETEDAILDFYQCQSVAKRNRDARKYRNSQKVEKYKNDYISVVDDKITGEPKLVFNSYVMLNELRAWQVQSVQYLNGIRVMNSIGCLGNVAGTDEDICTFLQCFQGTFEQRMKLYAEFLDTHPYCKNQLQERMDIPMNIKVYYDRLGTAKLRALSWKEADILRVLKQMDMLANGFHQNVYNAFQVGMWYSRKHIKEQLNMLYNEHQIEKTAKAADLKKFFVCKEQKGIGKEGKREHGYYLLARKFL